MCGFSQNAFGATELPAHVFVVCFEGTAADLEELGVAPQSLDDVLGHVALPTEYLNRAVSHVLGHGGGEQLGAIGIETVAGLV